ncbi:KilA-N domain-containing protein [Halomonas sp. ISL-60]|uniref:KilA-N domain-containing protein n=1 Tax=Halomonas sp. ISL-56 TaxID=2819149 RepID=UPI001BE681AC|nr:KilA-N domain-containing protein [Halomonas sp. ISL-56]MBT2772904.1 KilA-N domain-containing protein [Halomonas sp. ISL-60]MBT2799951.1 KilA-N domain-containing protein [Halomonas sp. ISL-56]
MEQFTIKPQTCNFDNKLPVIAGHEITTDEHGRFNLNAIHRASRAGRQKRPSYWIATKQAQELINEVKSQSANLHFGHSEQSPDSGFGDSDQDKNSCLAPIHAYHGGATPGTFAHELLAISYAGWISPKFQLQVNQVFLDYRMGKLQQAEARPAYEALPNPLTPAHQRGIQKAVGRRCFNFPEPARPKAYKRIYSHLKDRFGVAKYDQIPDERYTEALGAVESYSFSGDFLEAEALPETKQVKVLDLDAWLDMNYYIKHRQMDSRRLLITPKFLIDSEYNSPTLRLVKEMEAEGHSLEACRLEVLSLRHHLSSCISKLEQMMGIAQGINGQAVSFARHH